MRMSPIAPKLIGSMLNLTFSICAGTPSASRKPHSKRASSSVPTLVISTHVVPSSERTVWNGSSSLAISFSSVIESDDRIPVIHLTDLCIEQAAFPEPVRQRLFVLWRHRDQQTAARLGIAHQCELRIRDGQLDASAKRIDVPLRGFGTKT